MAPTDGRPGSGPRPWTLPGAGGRRCAGEGSVVTGSSKSRDTSMGSSYPAWLWRALANCQHDVEAGTVLAYAGPDVTDDLAWCVRDELAEAHLDLPEDLPDDLLGDVPAGSDLEPLAGTPGPDRDSAAPAASRRPRGGLAPTSSAHRRLRSVRARLAPHVDRHRRSLRAHRPGDSRARLGARGGLHRRGPEAARPLGRWPALRTA